MAISYADFIESKTRRSKPQPVTSDKKIIYSPDTFDFQRECIRRAINNGKYALFCDTGLGKTLMQLSWAENVMKNHGPVILLAPLAVKEQTRKESIKFNIGQGCEIINYDQLHNVNASKYAGVVLDESSILKNFTGATRNTLIESFQNTPFKLACTATPAPNDHTELGNHSEFLGYLPRVEMLSEFFVHDAAKTKDWRLKGHAQREFWQWVRSWSTIMRSPEDIGFNGDQYKLPGLTESIMWIDAAPSMDHPSLSEMSKLRKATLSERVDAIKKEISENNEGQSLVWCDYNDESDAISKSIDGAEEVKGSQSSKIKAEKMMAFSEGDIKILVTKPKIAGFGMNWQKCNKMYFAGPSHSFESRYQCIRRCWRFGQKNPVTVKTCATPQEQGVLKNCSIKQAKHIQMGESSYV